jgi:site-specific DNA-methyltransferase (adenine-specific)
MIIEMRPLTSIKPYDNNPRHNEAAVDAVAASIREFGFRQPLVVDGDDVIIVGHTRYKAALKLGLETVPVHVARDLTAAQAKAYRIADNQTATLSSWDDDRLTQEILQLQGLDVDLTMTGFSAAELLRFVDPPVLEGATDPDAIPAPPERAQTQPGDLIVLGKHRLLCGDSSKAAEVDRLLDGAAIHLINSDPKSLARLPPGLERRPT